MKKKKSNPLMDYVKASRRGSREAEIELYGKPINHTKVVTSKKVYDRKKIRQTVLRVCLICVYMLTLQFVFKKLSHHFLVTIL